MTTEVVLEEGKYKLRMAPGYILEAFRYDELWRTFVGDKLIAAMYERIVELECKNS